MIIQTFATRGLSKAGKDRHNTSWLVTKSVQAGPQNVILKMTLCACAIDGRLAVDRI